MSVRFEEMKLWGLYKGSAMVVTLESVSFLCVLYGKGAGYWWKGNRSRPFSIGRTYPGQASRLLQRNLSIRRIVFVSKD